MTNTESATRPTMFQPLNRRRADPSADVVGDTVDDVVSMLFVLSVTVVLLLAERPVRQLPALAIGATLGADRRAATSGELLLASTPSLAVRIGPYGPPRSSRAARASGYRDPLESHRATVGPDARTPWHIRARAVIALILIVAAVGVALAGTTLVLIASGRFVLELLAG